ncbi:restriction endonuclease [Limosilactobacillus fastidiosus]|uniref:Mrr restriction system protein n=1 Tax=Limosilactobacillus fastidiosus TaxID=2759855 RepID=A0A7W3YD37_9LACO|nr:restriction endonuclease [Limosilactobacillus fastidiosus]MBB1062290.1 Mrr restriction system protein [Limosilactobacillus fastidiosus]MBB1086642.1 Mrr restriction system protein [Limosilactobacillus fastidiosus]MCD7083367.1 Mrr restriction system protein [Limosilactobacillus fastidiosus]MCD7086380.1 Mrr restriction system protein [Limosilactobacillus fastidiosus]MCD7115325.1 Mrr restriction system protein [Limosilactobacillus fastidiosus]
MKTFNKLNRREQEAYLMLPIIKGLKKLGGQASTKELKNIVVANDSYIPENVLVTIRKSRKGNEYLPFNFPFNFAVANLVMAKLLDRPHSGEVLLTEKGRTFDGTQQELNEMVYNITLPMWKTKSKVKNIHENDKVESDDIELADEPWRTKLLKALSNLSPAKFELFCRALVRKMSVDIDENIGVKLSGDGGIDGYGYMTTNDFRTTRVAIQAKKWNPNHFVSSPEIDKFRGAMDKYRSEYGIFITTSSFTRDAIKASRTGTRIITLIDGSKLIDLVAKYQLYVKPVVTYELDDFFTNDN